MNSLQKARSQMMINHPFFGSLIMSTPMQRDDTIPTAATDMRKIIYNLNFLDSLDAKVVICVLAHELFHIILMHGLRRGGRTHTRWNIACDHAINLQLKGMGFTIWEQCCADPQYADMSAEVIYDLLPSDSESGGGLGDDLIEPENMSSGEKAEVEQKIRQSIAQAASMARMVGQMPAGLERLIDGILSPPLPWQELLRKYATQVSHDDETWRRRNRRFKDVYLPSRWSERMGEVVVIGDTSGSMGNEVFAQIGAEINEIVEFCKPERVRVIWADDTDCALEEVFEPGEEVVLHPKGGGGTDMRKPLRHVEQFEPQVVILITDGCTPWPKQEPPYPLIICLTEDCPTPPVGDIVRITA